MLIKEVTVGDNLDNYGYPRKLLVVTAISAFSGGGNGEISFEEHGRGRMRKRELTWKQFERLKFIRKVDGPKVAAQPLKKPVDTSSAGFKPSYPPEGTTHMWKQVCRTCGIERRERHGRAGSGFTYFEYLVDGKWTQKRPSCAKGTPS